VAVVIDANLVVILAAKDPRAGMVERHMQAWLDAGEELHAPSLLPYEVANALTRLIAAGRLASGDLAEAWALVEAIPIQLHPLTAGPQVIETALRLHRASAYDAAYLVLAQQLGAELWTLDGPSHAMPRGSGSQCTSSGRGNCPGRG
jgi:predicted nucleic acid-binding protein